MIRKHGLIHKFLIQKSIYWSWESCCSNLIISICEGENCFQIYKTKRFFIDHFSEFAMFSLTIVWLYVHYQTMVHYQIFYIMLQINNTSLKKIAHCFLFSKSLSFHVIKVFYNVFSLICHLWFRNSDLKNATKILCRHYFIGL